MNNISTKSNEVKAVSKYIRMSPSKIRRILLQIQGKTYKEALLLLEFMPYKGCEPVIKVLRSAAANAKNNFGFDETKLRQLMGPHIPKLVETYNSYFDLHNVDCL